MYAASKQMQSHSIGLGHAQVDSFPPRFRANICTRAAFVEHSGLFRESTSFLAHLDQSAWPRRAWPVHHSELEFNDVSMDTETRRLRSWYQLSYC